MNQERWVKQREGSRVSVPGRECEHSRPGQIIKPGVMLVTPAQTPWERKGDVGGEASCRRGHLREPQKIWKGGVPGGGLRKGCEVGRAPGTPARPHPADSRRLPLVLLLLLLLALLLRQPVLPQHGLEVHVGLPLVQVLELLQVLQNLHLQLRVLGPVLQHLAGRTQAECAGMRPLRAAAGAGAGVGVGGRSRGVEGPPAPTCLLRGLLPGPPVVPISQLRAPRLGDREWSPEAPWLDVRPSSVMKQKYKQR